MKVSEELGELSEAVSRDLGYMSHKTDEYEDSMYEAADIIIALAALIVNHNNELHHKSPIETLAELKRAIAKKTRKYATAMGCAQ
jgi:NTP pyrophosphatase (non-canonical NTP hydrolase)